MGQVDYCDYCSQRLARSMVEATQTLSVNISNIFNWEQVSKLVVKFPLPVLHYNHDTVR